MEQESNDRVNLSLAIRQRGGFPSYWPVLSVEEGLRLMSTIYLNGTRAWVESVVMEVRSEGIRPY